VRLRAAAALRRLLANLGGEANAVIIFVDDLQWGDADSAEAILELLSPPTGCPLLVIGACRSDEMERSRFLHRFQALQAGAPDAPEPTRIAVGTLTESESRQLIIDAAPICVQEEDPIVDQIIAEAAGNPYLTLQLLESLHVDGESVTYRKLQDVIHAKLTGLPNLADGLLKLLTVFGRSISMAELAEAAGERPATISTLTRMRSEHLVRWLDEDDEPSIDIYHDKIRENVLTRIQASERKECHRILATTIERRGGGVDAEALHSVSLTNESLRPRLFDLSTQFDAAGETSKARYYGLLAAEQACDQLALEIAEEHYQIAGRNSEASSDKIRFRIAAGYADVLVKLGKVEDASNELDQAESLATKKIERARIHALRASVALKTSAERGIPKECARAIRQLGTRVPRTRVGFLLASVWEWLILACAGKRRTKQRTDAAPLDADIELTLRLVNRLAYFGHWDFPILLWTALKGQNLARKLPESADTATAYIIAGAGLNIMTLGRYAAGMRLIDRALEFSRNANDKLQEAHGAMKAGFVGALGRFEESQKYLSLAEQTFEELGASKEQVVVAAGFANTLFWQGNLAAAIRSSRTAFDLAIRYNRRGVFPGLLEPWARASEGDFPFKKLCDRLGDNDDWDREQLAAEASWHLHHERYADAQKALEKALGRLIRNPALAQQSASLLPMLVTAIRQRSESLRESDPRLSARLFRRALRRGRFAVLVCRLFPRQIPHSYREFALLSQSKGRLKRALKYAERSCNVAQQQCAQFEYAQSLLVKGRIAQELGMPSAETEIAAAEEQLSELRSEATQALTEANKI
jgi:tetratricopeptide (TPR) repeat protein